MPTLIVGGAASVGLLLEPLSADLGTSETAVVAHIADMIRCPRRAVNGRSANDGFWDVATIAAKRA